MNKLNKLCLVLLLSVSCFYGHSQNVDNHVLSPAGNSVTNSGNTLTYTMGEVLTPTLHQGNNSLTQGFNQPAKLIITNVSDVKTSYSLNTYPNPSQDIVNIDITGDISAPLSMEMYDNTGSKVSPAIMQNDKNKIRFNMESFASGYYIVHLVNSVDHSVSTLKIVKIN